MSCTKKMVIEAMFKSRYCLICFYMDEAIREILPDYKDYIEYRRVDILESTGRRRFLDLSISLFGEEGVYKQMLLAPLPSLFINGELFFDAIPPRDMLEDVIKEVIAELSLQGDL